MVSSSSSSISSSKYVGAFDRFLSFLCFISGLAGGGRGRGMQGELFEICFEVAPGGSGSAAAYQALFQNGVDSSY